jgi:7-carboxy-7-deazaguanine synthase
MRRSSIVVQGTSERVQREGSTVSVEREGVGIRVSEIYTSIQGEGPRTGMGTLFLRFGGCNLRCPGWPCDTLFAVLPEFRADWDKRSAGHIVRDVIDKCQDGNIANVCLTGGEPFLQNHEALRHVVVELLAHDIQVEAFSNGHMSYPDWAFEKVNFVMDWKLDGSGNPDTWPYAENYQRLKPTDAVKFVIKDHQDFEDAVQVWSALKNSVQAQWWAGVVWGQEHFTEATLVDLIQQEGLPWNLNVQTHKYLWPAEARGV